MATPKKQETATTKAYTELTLEQDSAEGSDSFVNPRVSVDKSELKSLADSIADRGLMYPLQVWATTDRSGKPIHVILDGGRRYRAIGMLRDAKRGNGLAKKIPVRIVTAETLEDATFLALEGNIQRKELSSYEIARTIAQQRDRGIEQQVIAAKLHRSKAWVSRQLAAWDNASDAVKTAWSDGKLPNEDVQALAVVRSPAGKRLAPAEQDKRLQEVLSARESGAKPGKAREARSRARGIAKGKPATKPASRPREASQASTLRAFVEVGTNSKSAYVRGAADMARFALGEFGVGDFDAPMIKLATKHQLLLGATPRPSASRSKTRKLTSSVAKRRKPAPSKPARRYGKRKVTRK